LAWGFREQGDECALPRLEAVFGEHRDRSSNGATDRNDRCRYFRLKLNPEAGEQRYKPKPSAAFFQAVKNVLHDQFL
jgi:hypothetical protein